MAFHPFPEAGSTADRRDPPHGQDRGDSFRTGRTDHGGTVEPDGGRDSGVSAAGRVLCGIDIEGKVHYDCGNREIGRKQWEPGTVPAVFSEYTDRVWVDRVVEIVVF